ncbi:AAA family ATPase [Pelosinus baikalensis]|uniref:AAA family ATPase n=1 Tax=Pelosinus baikalensis TaxID=2892015 RepID=A0ABS8HYB4_9FIRM|nr:AAA family ATPase [Pelosinus baikalensis]
MDAFLCSQKESSYILSGYAGTGKTTIAENIVKYGLSLKYECIITAPTNQATARAFLQSVVANENHKCIP